MKNDINLPINLKIILTLDEASALTGIGIKKIRAMSDEENCKFVLWNGNKRMIKREEFEKFLLNSYSI